VQQNTAEVDLKRRFPLRRRAGIRFSFRELSIFLTVISCCFAFDSLILETYFHSDEITSQIRDWMTVAILFSFMVWHSKYWHCRFSGMRTKYTITDGCFQITKGIIRRKRASIRLSHITDVYFKQTLLDKVFKLSHIYLHTPNNISGPCSFLRALGEKEGLALKIFLDQAIGMYKEDEEHKEWHEFFARVVDGSAFGDAPQTANSGEAISPEIASQNQYSSHEAPEQSGDFDFDDMDSSIVSPVPDLETNYNKAGNLIVNISQNSFPHNRSRSQRTTINSRLDRRSFGDSL